MNSLEEVITRTRSKGEHINSHMLTGTLNFEFPVTGSESTAHFISDDSDEDDPNFIFRTKTLHSPMRSGAKGFENSQDRLNLNLAPSPLPECFHSILQPDGSNPFLASPEIDMLDLESSELDEMLCPTRASNGGDTSLQRIETAGVRGTRSEIINTESDYSTDELECVVNSLDSPIISVQDLQFITDTNQALKAMFPHDEQRRFEPNEPENPDVADAIHEPMQRVPIYPCNHKSNHIEEGCRTILANNNYQLQDKHVIYSIVKEEDTSDSKDLNPQSFYQIIEEHVANQKRAQAQRERETNRALLNKYIQETVISRSNPSRFTTCGPDFSNCGPDFSNCSPRELNWADSRDASLPAIDLEVQEIVKRERKKLKNRVAASKCRKKKLEREAQLETRVNQLKEQNAKMAAVAIALRRQVVELRQQVLEHMHAGCPVALIPQQPFFMM